MKIIIKKGIFLFFRTSSLPPTPSIHIGIVGGMGTIASTAFLNTILNEYKVEDERSYPKITLLSDSSAPKRNPENIKNIASFINKKIELLEDIGATHTIVACLVAHALPLKPSISRISLSEIVK